METREVVIVSYARTPFTRAHKGEFKDTRPDTLAAEVIKAALDRVPRPDPATSRTSSSAARCPRASRA